MDGPLVVAVVLVIVVSVAGAWFVVLDAGRSRTWWVRAGHARPGPVQRAVGLVVVATGQPPEQFSSISAKLKAGR